MTPPPSNDPLHGVTLEMIVKGLVDHYGWEELGREINIRCFNFDPSVSSSLKFLRKTPWARSKVEKLYLDMRWEQERDSGERHVAEFKPATDSPGSGNIH